VQSPLVTIHTTWHSGHFPSSPSVSNNRLRSAVGPCIWGCDFTLRSAFALSCEILHVYHGLPYVPISILSPLCIMQRSVKTLYPPGQGSPPSRRRVGVDFWAICSTCRIAVVQKNEWEGGKLVRKTVNTWRIDLRPWVNKCRVLGDHFFARCRPPDHRVVQGLHWPMHYSLHPC
jgi:hypothetical protein